MDINNLETIPVEIIDTRPETEYGRALKSFMMDLLSRQQPQFRKKINPNERNVLTPGQIWQQQEDLMRNPHTYDADIQRYMDELMKERNRPMPQVPPLKNIIKEEVKRGRK